MRVLGLRPTSAASWLLATALTLAALPASATVIATFQVTGGAAGSGTMEITDAAFAARTVTAGDVVMFTFTSSLGFTFDETELTLVNFGINAPGTLFEGGSFFADDGPRTLRHLDGDVDTFYNWTVVGEAGDNGIGQWVIPEPATASLLLLGLAGFAARRERR